MGMMGRREVTLYMLAFSGSGSLEPLLVTTDLPQASVRTINSPIDMILGATLATQIILGVLALFSVASWILIIWKYRELRGVNQDADSFVAAMEDADDLQGLSKGIILLDDSPYRRVFRDGIEFFKELRPTALKPRVPARGRGSQGEAAAGLSPTQLEALWLILEKNLSREKDDLAHGLPWLAIIGSVSPLMGLMGTVVGVMNSFIGITSQGSANIAAVAPGIAEALTTTVAGLAVAIPAVIAYNHFASRLRLFTGELEGFASEFVGILARDGLL